jgi:hypothetical protein
VWLLGLEIVIGAVIVWAIEARTIFLIADDGASTGERLL